MQQVEQVLPELHPERVTEPELLADLVQLLRADRVVPGELLDGVGRQHPEQEEVEDRDEEQRGRGRQDLAEDVPQRAVAVATAAP